MTQVVAWSFDTKWPQAVYQTPVYHLLAFGGIWVMEVNIDTGRRRTTGLRHGPQEQSGPWVTLALCSKQATTSACSYPSLLLQSLSTVHELFCFSFSTFCLPYICLSEWNHLTRNNVGVSSASLDSEDAGRLVGVFYSQEPFVINQVCICTQPARTVNHLFFLHGLHLGYGNYFDRLLTMRRVPFWMHLGVWNPLSRAGHHYILSVSWVPL